MFVSCIERAVEGNGPYRRMRAAIVFTKIKHLVLNRAQLAKNPQINRPV